MVRMEQLAIHGTALQWAIKDTLVSYVRGMKDGTVTAFAPATAHADGFEFAAAAPDSALCSDRAIVPSGTLKFCGQVLLLGHGGMLKLPFKNPWLTPGATPQDPWALTIADPYEPGARLTFATIAQLTVCADSTAVGGDVLATTSGTTLTQDGADLFFAGPYHAGIALDNPRVVAESGPGAA